MLTDHPGIYFDVLDACGALERVFPELHCLKDIPQRPDYHAEGDTWVHTRMVLEQACAFSAELSDVRKLRVRMAALLHDLGKANTPFEELWADNGDLIGSHHGHEDLERFGPPLEALSERIKMPGDVRQFVAGVALVHQKVHSIFKAGGHGLVSLYQALDLSRKLRHDPHILDDVALACAADNYGRLTLLKDGSKVAPTSYHQADYFKKAMLTIHAVDPGTVINEVLAKGHGLKTAKEQLLGRQRGSVKPMIAEHRALGEDAIAEMLGTRA
jgi:tRNA nucleotidyltransferase (CCA-adding enzyme)